MNNISNENYFYCSIKTQWKNYLKYAIKENLIINNLEDKQLLFIRSVNSQTCRTNGLFLDKNKTNEIYKHNILFWLSYYTFKNKPIRMINIEKVYSEDKKKVELIKMNLTTYKLDYNYNINNQFIYIPNDNFGYTKPEMTEKEKLHYKEDIYNYLPCETGIEDTEEYKFLIPIKKNGFKTKDINFIRCESDRIINNVSFKKMRNIEEDEIYAKQKLEILREEQKKNIEIEKKYLYLQEEINKIILKYEKMHSKGEITKLSDLENGKLYNLICFRGYKSDSYLCLFKNNDNDEKYYLIWADFNVKTE